MLGYFIWLFPFSICFGYFMQMLMRRNKSPLLKVVTCLIGVLGAYFLSYSYECNPDSSELSLIIVDLAEQWTAPFVMPLGMAIMNGLRHKKMFSTSVLLWSVPGLLLGISSLLIVILGLGEDTRILVCHTIQHIVLGIEVTYFFFRNFLHMGGKDFAWHRLLTFFTQNSASQPLMVIGVSFNVFILCMAVRLFFGPATYNEYWFLGHIRLIVISMIMLLMFNALSQVHSPWITLKSIFDTSYKASEGLEEDETTDIKTAATSETEMATLPTELSVMSPAESGAVLDRIDRLAIELVKYMEEEKAFLNADISIEKVSAHLNTNRFYISRLVNVEKSMSFRDYVNSLRIEYAKAYMKANPDVNQEHIAVACGFSSASYFNRKFKQVTGISPQDWKKE